ncbi:phage tail assembly protein [Anaerocolumna sp. AGMB13025]|uniref:phage tail assembly protein n=1 Tax=Anaerocolumna sp. AGMB13025 TaxID=3039116 RepID=UPI00241EB84C|nr:phage tail assembly protein [Anaerocolumna sp. AGMB13025]WFR55355.1 phage tail assembly protein [Anaerocolumna sp. AGMB13025]
MNENEVKVTEELTKVRVIKFKVPYTFECTDYKEIDLSGLDNLTTDDLLQAETLYLRTGGTSINPETTILYSMILAHIASDKPLEFFGKLPAKEAMKIKREVYSFFYTRA